MAGCRGVFANQIFILSPPPTRAKPIRMTEERFIGGWTRTSLAARTPAERYAIWKRARLLRTADGNQLAREIERLGLPYEEPDRLPEDHPMCIAMATIITSPEGRSACVEATLDGLPAIAGVDPLLHDALGREYRQSDEAVATAQSLVAQVMDELGYAPAANKVLPSRYIARAGVFWKRKPPA
jgi:hypothetical protein